MGELTEANRALPHRQPVIVRWCWMTRTLEAVYENGVLRPLEPLALEEHQRVQVTVSPMLPAGEDVLDLEYLRSLEGMLIPEVSLEEVRRRLAKIPGTMTADFIAEREGR